MQIIRKIILTTIFLISCLNAENTKNVFINSYYSNIAERLSEWEPVGTKQKAVIEIYINKNGKFDYKIIKEANSKEFNDSLRDFLEKQKNIRYPIYKNKDMKLNVDFKTED